MDQERFQRIDAIFDVLLDAPAERRDELLAEHCGDDDALRGEVLRLIDAASESGDFIEAVDFKPARALLDDPDFDDLAGRKIGSYRLKSLIGRGGMGVVYLATRIDDFEKVVAIKLIPFGNRNEAAESFRRERQILAQLSHPFIAQILDGGTTDGGSPFIVMEFVDGIPLDEYCRRHNLDVRAKLRLFEDICRAVTYAHRNFVVHRDLKPNNILVTADAKPKLLDFGIAKLLNSDASNKARSIEIAALTPEYASPEQFRGENLSAAGDVYSLGVVLYEILAGRRPLSLREMPLSEAIRTVERESPRPPSEFAEGDRFGSDLDAVVLKSLAKNPSERYQAVEDLRVDIDNYLRDLPVSARVPTAGYRFVKYLKRHKFESGIATVFALVILSWFVTAMFQAESARRSSESNRRSAYAAQMILASAEYRNANLNALRDIVERFVPTDGEVDLRGFEWHYLNRLLNPPAKTATFEHPDEVWGAEFSPDGQLVATACNDNRVRIWNVTTGRMIETEEQKGAWKVSFFPDGKRLAVSSSSNSAPMIRIYETETGARLIESKPHTKRIRAVDVSPDGNFLATGSQDGDVVVADSADGREVRRISFGNPERGAEIYDVQFSRDGKRLVVLGFETLAMVELGTGVVRKADMQAFAEQNLQLTGWKVTFSPLEKTLVIGTFAGEVAFVDAATLNISRILRVHRTNVKSLAFSGDGKTVITASGDRIVKFIDFQSGLVVNELRGHFSGVHEVIVSPDGKTLGTASADFKLHLWNLNAVSQNDALLTDAQVSAFSSDGRLVFGWNNRINRFASWKAEERTQLTSTALPVNPFSTVFLDDVGAVAVGERAGFVSVIDAKTAVVLNRWRPAERNLFAIDAAADGSAIFTGSEDGIVRRIDGSDGSSVFASKVADDAIKSVALSPDGKFIASGGNAKDVRILDAATGAVLAELGGNMKPVLHVRFSRDGRYLASGGADDVVRIWDHASRILVRELKGFSAGVAALDFSPDGKRLVTASDVGVVRLWDMETGEQVLAVPASEKQITQVRFTTDGRTIIVADTAGRITTLSAL